MSDTPEYSAEVLAHFRAPHHAGRLEGEGVIVGEAGSKAQGRWIRLQARPVAGRIRDVGFLAYGCPGTIACCSLLAQWLHQAPIEQSRRLDARRLIEALSLAPVQRAAALAAEDALLDLLRRMPDSGGPV